MVARPEGAPRLDRTPALRELREELRVGLKSRPRRLPCKLLYDTEGSRLFERITQLDEYYPTRTETGILRDRGFEIADRIGPGALVLEFGCGSGIKTGLLLDALDRPAAYVPIDIWKDGLDQLARRLKRSHPQLDVRPVHADYNRRLRLPPRILEGADGGRRVVFFPGSTIGNFTAPEARAFLRRVRELLAPRGVLVVGVDLKKDPNVLHAAYNDREGVTAAFNRNLLAHVNRILGADFDPAAFDHYAFYEPSRGRVEMHLVSRCDQQVRLDDERIKLRKGESIHTENSHKYTVDEFEALAATGGFVVEAVFTDRRDWFGVFLLRPRADRAAATDRALGREKKRPPRAR